MQNIYVVINKLTSGYSELWFIIIPIGAVLCGTLVIVNKNPIVSVLFLIGLFLNIAVLLIFLGLNFLGLSYLLVYVGAISILFLFILMLINIRSSDLSSNTVNSIPLAFVVGILYASLVQNLFLIYVPKTELDTLNCKSLNISNLEIADVCLEKLPSLEIANSFAPINISNVCDANWDTNLVYISDISGIGNILYTNYSMWLVLTSLILLLAMVGAIVITIKQK